MSISPLSWFEPGWLWTMKLIKPQGLNRGFTNMDNVTKLPCILYLSWAIKLLYHAFNCKTSQNHSLITCKEWLDKQKECMVNWFDKLRHLLYQPDHIKVLTLSFWYQPQVFWSGTKISWLSSHQVVRCMDTGSNLALFISGIWKSNALSKTTHFKYLPD